jgi:hypothetical protein
LESSHALVVARHKGDLAWVRDLLETHKWITNVLVYNKCDDVLPWKHPHVTEYQVPNMGREGETYLRFMLETQALPDHLWFFQEAPFNHAPRFTELFEQSLVKKQYSAGFQGLTLQYKNHMPPGRVQADRVAKCSAGAASVASCVQEYRVRKRNFQVSSTTMRKRTFLSSFCAMQVCGPEPFWDIGIDFRVNEIGHPRGKPTAGEGLFFPKYMDTVSEFSNMPPLPDHFPFFFAACFYTHADNVRSVGTDRLKRLIAYVVAGPDEVCT